MRSIIYHCPKGNTTRRQANITEAHFITERPSRGAYFYSIPYFSKITSLICGNGVTGG